MYSLCIGFKVAAQLLAALSLLHRSGVIHADIKPENILLRDNDATCCAVKLADFGNAMNATEEDTAMYYGSFELQSLWYRAPEVILGLPFSCAIDMWSAGCVLAELYLGEPLFVGADNAAVRGLPPPFQRIVAVVPFDSTHDYCESESEPRKLHSTGAHADGGHAWPAAARPVCSREKLCQTRGSCGGGKRRGTSAVEPIRGCQTALWKVSFTHLTDGY